MACLSFAALPFLRRFFFFLSRKTASLLAERLSASKVGRGPSPDVSPLNFNGTDAAHSCHQPSLVMTPHISKAAQSCRACPRPEHDIQDSAHAVSFGGNSVASATRGRTNKGPAKPCSHHARSQGTPAQPRAAPRRSTHRPSNELTGKRQQFLSECDKCQ